MRVWAQCLKEVLRDICRTQNQRLGQVSLLSESMRRDAAHRFGEAAQEPASGRPRA